MTMIPGIKAIHCVVSDTCRDNRTDLGAALEAWNRVSDEWTKLLQIHESGKNIKFHLILSVEFPEHS